MRTGRTDDLKSLYEKAFNAIGRGTETFSPRLEAREVGTVKTVNTGIATVSGLPGAGFEELLEFPGGIFGIAFNVDEDEIGVVLLGEYSHLFAGDEVRRTGRVMDTPVGNELLGRVIDPLGRPIDGEGPIRTSQRLPIERPSAPIMDRAPVQIKIVPDKCGSIMSKAATTANANKYGRTPVLNRFMRS